MKCDLPDGSFAVVEVETIDVRALRELPTDRYGHVFGVHDRRKAMLRALGVADIIGHVRFHDLRHTAYTHIKEALLRLYDPKMALADVRLLFGQRRQEDGPGVRPPNGGPL